MTLKDCNRPSMGEQYAFKSYTSIGKLMLDNKKKGNRGYYE